MEGRTGFTEGGIGMPRIRQNADKYRNEDFAREISARLKYLGLQQHDLAEYLGVCDATVSTMLRHPEKMTAERMRKVIHFLQLDTTAVLLFCGFQKKQINKESA